MGSTPKSITLVFEYKAWADIVLFVMFSACSELTEEMRFNVSAGAKE